MLKMDIFYLGLVARSLLLSFMVMLTLVLCWVIFSTCENTECGFILM